MCLKSWRTCMALMANVFFETDESRRKESLACAFRIADLSVADLKAVSAFKDVVKSYLKMCTIEAEK